MSKEKCSHTKRAFYFSGSIRKHEYSFGFVTHVFTHPPTPSLKNREGEKNTKRMLQEVFREISRNM
jgi:hypothetical protein